MAGSSGSAGSAGSAQAGAGAGAAGGTGGSSAGRGGTTGGGGATGGVSGSAGTAGGVPGGGSSGSNNGGMAGTVAGESGAAGGAGVGTAGGGGEGGVVEPPGCDPENVSVEICDGLDNDCSGSADDEGTCPEHCTGATLDGRGYMLCDEPAQLAFAEAEAACQAQSPDMHLVWIESAQENSFLVDAADEAGIDNTALWIGASDADDEDEWFWVPGGEKFWDDNDGPGGSSVGGRYENWGTMQPNNAGQQDNEDCGSLTISDTSSMDGIWNDLGCELAWGYICEVRAP